MNKTNDSAISTLKISYKSSLTLFCHIINYLYSTHLTSDLFRQCQLYDTQQHQLYDYHKYKVIEHTLWNTIECIIRKHQPTSSSSSSSPTSSPLYCISFLHHIDHHSLCTVSNTSNTRHYYHPSTITCRRLVITLGYLVHHYHIYERYIGEIYRVMIDLPLLPHTDGRLCINKPYRSSSSSSSSSSNPLNTTHHSLFRYNDVLEFFTPHVGWDHSSDELRDDNDADIRLRKLHYMITSHLNHSSHTTSPLLPLPHYAHQIILLYHQLFMKLDNLLLLQQESMVKQANLIALQSHPVFPSKRIFSPFELQLLYGYHHSFPHSRYASYLHHHHHHDQQQQQQQQDDHYHPSLSSQLFHQHIQQLHEFLSTCLPPLSYLHKYVELKDKYWEWMNVINNTEIQIGQQDTNRRWIMMKEAVDEDQQDYNIQSSKAQPTRVSNNKLSSSPATSTASSSSSSSSSSYPFILPSPLPTWITHITSDQPATICIDKQHDNNNSEDGQDDDEEKVEELQIINWKQLDEMKSIKQQEHEQLLSARLSRRLAIEQTLVHASGMNQSNAQRKFMIHT